MTWLEAVPGLLATALLWTVGGWATLRLLGVRGLLALGAGPAVTTGTAGVLAIAYDLVGVPWSLTTFLLGSALVVALAAVLGRLLGTTSDPRGLGVAGQRALTRSERAWLVVTWALGGGVLGAALMAGMGTPDTPAQAWDAVFHLNALQVIRDTGNASSLGGLAPMYADTVAPFYPAVWHGLVAVMPGFGTVNAAANAANVVLASWIWIAGLVALARVVWPRRALSTVLVPVVAATFVTFPAVAVSMLSVWPYALSTALLPGTIALLVAAVRGVLTWQLHLVHALAMVAAVAGVVLAHASGLFSLALLALPLLTVLLARQLLRTGRGTARTPGRPWTAAALGLAWVVAVVGGIAFLVSFPPVQAIMDYRRGGQDSYLPSLASLTIDHPLIYVYKITSVNLVVTLLTLLGIALTVRWRHARWLGLAWIMAVVVTLLAAGPADEPLRVLAGFWYTQPSRINALVTIPAILLAAGAAAWVIRLVARRSGLGLTPATAVVVLGLVVLTSGLRWTTQTQVVASMYTAIPIAWGTILEPEETAMIDRAAETLPEDAVILGEPVAGSPYYYHRAGIDVVYPQLSPIDDPARIVLQERFRDWKHDPEVCEAVRELGVTHVHADSLTFHDHANAKWEETTPGLRNLDPTSLPESGASLDGTRSWEDAWVKVDEGGHASLWEFTGCS